MGARSRSASWPFDRKFKQWLTDNDLSISRAAKKLDVPYATLHGWVKSGVRVSAAGMGKIAALTGLPSEYWTNKAVPYPPPADYLDATHDLEAAMSTMSVDELRAWIRILSDPVNRSRALALWQASESGRP